jgi:CIC family chloride channel protein
MTSVFMIFEITQDYQIIVPLMVANLLSFVISRRYQPLPVYEALLRQDGIHLPSSAIRERPAWTAGDAMSPPPAFIPADTPVAAACETALTNGRPAHLVGAAGCLLGVITSEQLAGAREAGRGTEAVGTLVENPFAHVHPDHGLDVVLERFAESTGLLPVVSRAAASRVEGVITLEDITQLGKRRRTE